MILSEKAINCCLNRSSPVAAVAVRSPPARHDRKLRKLRRSESYQCRAATNTRLEDWPSRTIVIWSSVSKLEKPATTAFHRVLAHLSKSNSRTFKDFQGPYEGYIRRTKLNQTGTFICIYKQVQFTFDNLTPASINQKLELSEKFTKCINSCRSRRFRKSNSSTFKYLQTQIQGLSRTTSVFKDFPGLENLEKNQGLSRTRKSPGSNTPVFVVRIIRGSWSSGAAPGLGLRSTRVCGVRRARKGPQTTKIRS